ncbi:MAG: hypothetical protein KDA45_13520 [Planctomycetales bacterium]|nr:hypothetical protein [Planctomycetales bacterium]
MLSLLALLSVASSGCSVVHNGYTAIVRNGSWNDTVVVLRNRSYSAKAWHRRKQHFCEQKHLKDFCNGFRAGYEGVSSGADGCTPAFPPSEYWGWEYQSGEGQARTAAWFSGYPHGARAAEEDGHANWNQVQMSPSMQAYLNQAAPQSSTGPLHPIPDPALQNGVPYGAQQYGVPAPGGQSYGVPMADGSVVPLESIPHIDPSQFQSSDGLPAPNMPFQP